MDFHGFFKKMFGNNYKNTSEDNPPLHDHNRHNIDQKDDYSFSIRFPSNDDRFGIEGMFGGDLFRQMNQMHRHMDEMMKSFGFRENNFPDCQESLPPPIDSGSDEFSNEFPNNQNPHSFWFILDGPTFLSPGHDGSSQVKQKKHPRDLMLKDDFIDDDDDGGGSGGPGGLAKFLPETKTGQGMQTPTVIEPFQGSGMDKMLNLFEPMDSPDSPVQEGQSPTKLTQPCSFFSSSSSSFSTVSRPGGRTEQKRTVRKLDGSEETTITRSSGGQSHTVTTVRASDGTQQTSETFNNMEEKDLDAFNQLWQGRLSALPGAPTSTPSTDLSGAPSSAPPSAPMPGMTPQDRDIFNSLFGKWK